MSHKFIFFLNPEDVSSDSATFSRAESHHLDVLRQGAGCQVEAIDGCGRRYCLQLDEKQGGLWRGAILSQEMTEPAAPLPISLALPCLKAERWESALEAACEMGIERVVLTEYRQAVVSWTDARLDKARRKAVEALKQSGGSRLTEITGPLNLTELLNVVGGLNVYLTEKEAEAFTGIMAPAMILVGPEAGFHPEEESVLKAAGVQRFNLGKRRLRSEIACIAALSHAAVHLS